MAKAKKAEKEKEAEKEEKTKAKVGPFKVVVNRDAHTSTSTHFLATHFPFAFLHCGHNRERSRLERVEFPSAAAAHHMASQPASNTSNSSSTLERFN